MCSFICSFTFLFLIIILMLDGSPALSPKGNGVKESGIKTVGHGVRAKSKQIHKPRKNPFQKIIKQDLKVDRTKKMSKVFHQRSHYKEGIKHINKLRSKAKKGKYTAFYKKKKTDPMLKSKKMKKNKPARFVNNKLKNKHRRIQKKKTRKQRFPKRQPKSLKNVPPKVSPNSLEKGTIKKDIQNATGGKVEAEVIKKDVNKNVTGDKKEVKLDSGNLQISTPKNQVTSKSTTVQQKEVTTTVMYHIQYPYKRILDIKLKDASQLDLDDLYAGGDKEACVYDYERKSCVSFNKLLDVYPGVAKNIKNTFIPKIDRRWPYYLVNQLAKNWIAYLNSHEDKDAALFILVEIFMKEFGRTRCDYITGDGVLPFLREMFRSINEPCQMS